MPTSVRARQWIFYPFINLCRTEVYSFLFYVVFLQNLKLPPRASVVTWKINRKQKTIVWSIKSPYSRTLIFSRNNFLSPVLYSILFECFIINLWGNVMKINNSTRFEHIIADMENIIKRVRIPLSSLLIIFLIETSIFPHEFEILSMS